MTGIHNERAMKRCRCRMFYDDPHGSLAGRWVSCELERGHREPHQGAGLYWTTERAIFDERRIARPEERGPTYREQPVVGFDESTTLGCWRAWLTNDHHQLRSRLAAVERRLEELEKAPDLETQEGG